jgi:hypothetical protein
MASKKAGRLAGLAALAGLAYMANEKGKGKAETKSDAKDTPAPDRDDSERVIGSRVRKDDDITVAGEGGFDTPADMSSSPRVGTPARTASSVKAPSAPVTKMPEGAYRGMRSDMKDVGGGRSSGRGGPEAGEEAAFRAKAPAAPEGALRGMRSDMPSSGLGGVRRPGTNVNYENEDTKEMKRGGKVKKMASGGMTSKRGDGIASKGKTRCKMY